MEYLSEKRRAGTRGVNKDLQDYQELYDVLRNTSIEAFDVSMYLTERGETTEDATSETVANAARRAPANLTPVSPRWAQLDALISASPVGVDGSIESGEFRRFSVQLPAPRYKRRL